MEIHAINDENQTWTATYIAFDPESKDAVVIDPVLDIDTMPWRTSTDSLDKVCDFIKTHALTLHWILDTHVHADHLSGASELKSRLNAPIAINANVIRVQKIFSDIFNMPDYPSDGSQFDRLLQDNDQLTAGTLIIDVIHTPGHTPACNCYMIGDAIFAGDVMFMPDVGVARCDFPEGSARDLYHSVTTRLYTLPDETRVFSGHDYPDGREFRNQTTIGECKASNVDLPEDISEEEFVKRAEARDSKLPAPRLLFPSLLANINAGRLPQAESNDVSYLKIPVNFL